MIEEEPLAGSPISAPSEESGVVLAELVALVELVACVAWLDAYLGCVFSSSFSLVLPVVSRADSRGDGWLPCYIYI